MSALSFSIVTPTLNARQYLAETARSILAQHAGAEDGARAELFEWVVIDGGSTDGTLDLLRDLAACDPRVVVSVEQGASQSGAINRGLDRARGDVCGWLNADDLYAPGAFAAVAGALARDPAAPWVIGRCEIIGPDGARRRDAVTRYKDWWLRRYSHRRLLRENFISQPAVFWRRDLGRAAGPLDESLHYAMDYDLWLRMAALRDPLVLPAVLARFRLHPASKSGRLNRAQFDEQFRVARRYLNGDPLGRCIHKLNIEKIVAAYRLMRAVGW